MPQKKAVFYQCRRADGFGGDCCQRILSSNFLRSLYELNGDRLVPMAAPRRGISLGRALARDLAASDVILEQKDLAAILDGIPLKEYPWQPLLARRCRFEHSAAGERVRRTCHGNGMDHTVVCWFVTEWCEVAGFEVGDLIGVVNGCYYRVPRDDFLFFHGES